MSSSFVGMMTTGTLESLVEITISLPRTLFAFLSSLTPRAARRFTMRSRTSDEFSPMPPVITIASAPPTIT